MVAYVRVHARQMSTYYFSGRLILVNSHSQAVVPHWIPLVTDRSRLIREYIGCIQPNSYKYSWTSQKKTNEGDND